jgi:ankyrin repeat protein
MITPDEFGTLLRNGTDEAKMALYQRIAVASPTDDLTALLQGTPDHWNGYSALHNCIATNHLPWLQLLVQKGNADLTVCDAEGITLLMLAVQQPQSQQDIANYLLQEMTKNTADRGSSKTRMINARDHLGRTALFWALMGNNNESSAVIMELLLQHGANPNCAAHDGTTPLLQAIQQRRRQGHTTLSTVRLLHQYGAQLDMVNPHNGNNALHYAVQPLLSTTATTTATSNELQLQQLELVQWLLDQQPDGAESLLLAKNHAGQTPLDVVLATTRSSKQDNNNTNNNKPAVMTIVAHMLLERYQNYIVAQQGDLCLHWILQTAVFATNDDTVQLPVGTLSVDQFVTMLSWFIESRSCMRTVDASGAMPLHVACQNSSPPPMAVLQVLVQQDPTAVRQRHTANGNVPLQELLLNGDAAASLLETVQYLLDQYPASIATVNDQKQSPWAVAALSLSTSVDVLFHLMQAHPCIALASFREC